MIGVEVWVGTVLFFASQQGRTEVVAYLLGVEGIDVNAASVGGATALHWASRDGHTDRQVARCSTGSQVHVATCQLAPRSRRLRGVIAWCIVHDQRHTGGTGIA